MHKASCPIFKMNKTPYPVYCRGVKLLEHAMDIVENVIITKSMRKKSELYAFFSSLKNTTNAIHILITKRTKEKSN